MDGPATLAAVNPARGKLKRMKQVRTFRSYAMWKAFDAFLRTKPKHEQVLLYVFKLIDEDLRGFRTQTNASSSAEALELVIAEGPPVVDLTGLEPHEARAAKRLLNGIAIRTRAPK